MGDAVPVLAVDDGAPPAFLAWVRVVLGGAVLLGLAGVIALMGIDVAGRADELLGALAIASVALLPAVAVDPPASMPSASALLALVVLGLFCTAAGSSSTAPWWPRRGRVARS